jgi:phosphoribosylformylglycinamidine synthase
MFVLTGRSALSSFRRERLNREVQAVAPGVAVTEAWWVYLVEPERGAEPDRERLAAILQADGDVSARANRYVLPRIGTISPWSSKATEILRGCGEPVARVERAMALAASGLDAAAEPARRASLAKLHDPMTQSIVEHLDDAASLFRAGAPAPLAHVAHEQVDRLELLRPSDQHDVSLRPSSRCSRAIDGGQPGRWHRK